MRADGNLAGVEFIAPPMYHRNRQKWEEIISESGYWFTKGAMRGFNSRIAWDTLTKIDQGTYGFISSEQDTYSTHPYARAWEGERRYTARKWTKADGVLPLSDFGEFDTLKQAREWLTRGGFTERTAP